MSPPPLWRRAFDAAERTVAPRADRLVRTPSFSVAAALVRRVDGAARGAARGITARAWHLVNLPARSDVSRLHVQIGALDREVRRLTMQLDMERRRTRGSPSHATIDPTTPEERHADGPEPTGGPRPRPARRRAQRPSGS